MCIYKYGAIRRRFLIQLIHNYWLFGAGKERGL